MWLPAFRATLTPAFRSNSQNKQIQVLCILCCQYDFMIKTRYYRVQPTLKVTDLENSLHKLKSILRLSSSPLPLACHLWVCSPVLQCIMFFAGLPFGWLTRNPQWPNILLNLSQVWTVTRAVKFMHHHSDWLPLSCFWHFSQVTAGATPEKNGDILTILHSSAEWENADPCHFPLLSQIFFSVVDGCVKQGSSCNAFLWIYKGNNGEWCPSTLLLLITLLLLVLWLWLQVITLHYLGSHSSFVGPVKSLPIWRFSCLVTVTQHSTSLCTHCSSALGTAKRKKQHI